MSETVYAAASSEAALLKEMLDGGLMNQSDYDSQMAALVGDAVQVAESNEIDGATEVKANETLGATVVSDDDLAEIERQEEAAELRQAAYAEQTGDTMSINTEDAPQTVQEAPGGGTTGSTPRKARKASTTPAAPRKGAFTSPGAFVASFYGDEVVLYENDISQVKIDTASLIDTVNAKKVKEKIVNFFDAYHNNKNYSVYTKLAIDYLREHGKISAGVLVALLTTTSKKHNIAASYSDGTARSQAQQQISMLRTLGIINPNGELHTDSTFAKGLGLIKAP